MLLCLHRSGTKLWLWPSKFNDSTHNGTLLQITVKLAVFAGACRFSSLCSEECIALEEYSDTVQGRKEDHENMLLCLHWFGAKFWFWLSKVNDSTHNGTLLQIIEGDSIFATWLRFTRFKSEEYNSNRQVQRCRANSTATHGEQYIRKCIKNHVLVLDHGFLNSPQFRSSQYITMWPLNHWCVFRRKAPCFC